MSANGVQVELFVRDAELARMAKEHREIIAALRAELRELSRREDREVTADDARPFLDRWGVPPGNWLGTLFKSREWEPVGLVHSSTPGSHGNLLRSWRPRGTP